MSTAHDTNSESENPAGHTNSAAGPTPDSPNADQQSTSRIESSTHITPVLVKKDNKSAVLALVFALISPLFYYSPLIGNHLHSDTLTIIGALSGPILALVAIIFGCVGLYRIRSNPYYRGKDLALTGIGLGIFSFIPIPILILSIELSAYTK